MNGAQATVLSSWKLYPFLLSSLFLVGFIYTRGWRIVSRQLPTRFPAWRLTGFFTGLLTLYIAAASPLDAFAGFLLQVHMIQHLLFTVVAPPLILLGAPFVPILRGMPRIWAREIVASLLNGPLGRNCSSFFGRPIVAWIFFVSSMLIWHIPGIYDRALYYDSWHAFEHFCFFSSGLLFWHHIILPWPARNKQSRWWILLYILSADLANTFLAAFLTFYDQPLYATYEVVPRLWGITAIDDQVVAGVIMWVPGSIAFLVPAFFITCKLLSPKYGIRPSQQTPTAYLPKARASVTRPKNRSILTTLAKSPIRRVVQAFILLLVLVVITDAFFGPRPSALNLAGILPWTYWRGFSVLALLTLGNIFCAVCPFTFFRNLVQRLLPFGKQRQWPHKLSNKWPAIVLLIAFLWAYEVLDLWDRPVATAFLLILYFSSIAVVDSLFRKGSFCKYLCPVGNYQFVFSTLSSTEVKIDQADVCAGCRTQDCLRGNSNANGCETALFLPSKKGNLDCTFCLDCVRACPHDNIHVSVVLPGRDLASDAFHSTLGRYGERTDLAVLLMVFCAGAFINAAGMIAPVTGVFQRLTNTGIPKSLTVTLFILIGTIALPLVFGHMVAKLSKVWSRTKTTTQALMKRFVYGFVPLGASIWAAHFLFHFAMGAFTAAPVFKRFFAQMGIGEMSQAMVIAGGFTGGWIMSLEILLLDLGYLLSLYVLWQISKNVFSQRSFRGFLPWAILATSLFCIALWILFQPMEMRGMPD